MTIVSQAFDHVIGVDTHAKTHTLFALDRHGACTGKHTFPTHPAGLARAQAWITRTAPGQTLIAMEGTGSYGATFCDLLTQTGFQVAETKPPRRGTRRAGKSDEIDAEQAARYALSLPLEKVLHPRTHNGDFAALSVLLTARNAIGKNRSASVNQLTALLRGHALGIDARNALNGEQISQVAAWRSHPSDDAGTATIRAEATREAHEILRRDTEMLHNEKGLRKHVQNLAGWLLDEYGVGPVVAGQLLVSWSGPGRIRSEAAYARLGGVAPIPASSGNTTRHRIHHGGDRQLNRALWIAAWNRYYHDANTADYVQRRLAEGKTPNDIIRMLKRYIARSLFRKLEHHTA